MARVKPGLIGEIKRLGAFDVTACYSCGVCTAVCPLSEEEGEFPRRIIRYGLLGLEDRLLSSPELWLCYYCGECTRSCPRGADPGGYMMAARRYAITRYSLGSVARVFYNKLGMAVSLILLSLLMVAGILVSMGSPNMARVDIFSFVSMEAIHLGGVVLGAFVGVMALINIVIMYLSMSKSPRLKGGSAPLGRRISVWVQTFFETLVKEVLVELRYLKCENRNRFYAHMAIFWGFVLLFAATSINFLTGVRQVSAMVLGAIGGVLIIYGSGYFIYKRLSKDEEYAQSSHITDWVFTWLIMLAGVTGFLLDLFMILGNPMQSYLWFAAHLVVVFDLIVTAPFTKFAHAVYRPFALWIWDAKNRLKKKQ